MYIECGENIYLIGRIAIYNNICEIYSTYNNEVPILTIDYYYADDSIFEAIIEFKHKLIEERYFDMFNFSDFIEEIMGGSNFDKKYDLELDGNDFNKFKITLKKGDDK